MVSDEKIKVHFIDYGTSKTVPLKTVKHIPTEFISCLPKLAARCSIIQYDEEDELSDEKFHTFMGWVWKVKHTYNQFEVSFLAFSWRHVFNEI